MTDEDDGMDSLADGSVRKTDAQLAEEELKLLFRTDSKKLLSLRPKVSDPATFDRLLEEVAASTAANESLAQLKDRLTRLGASAAGLVKEAARLL